MYDTLIIGAGLSGLAAGIRLAYYDRRVCILERHTTIGGLNSFYRLDGRNYDVGLHAITNYVPKGTKRGPLARLLRQLRIGWDELALKPQVGSRVAFPGITLEFDNDFRRLEAEIAQKFPKQIDRFRALVARIGDYDDLDFSADTQSARAILNETISDPLLVEMLLCPLLYYGSAREHDMDWSQFCVMFRSIYCEGLARPLAGVRLILKKLVRKFKDLGGELRLRAGVRSIAVEGEEARTVTLDDETQVEGRTILSSAGWLETMRLCEDVSEVDARSAGQLSFVESMSVLNVQPRQLGCDRTIVFFNDSQQFRWQKPDTLMDVRSGVICSPNNFVYDEPSGEGLMRVTALANFDRWASLSEDDYRRAKLRGYDELAASAVRFVPDFRSSVIATDMFTPTTVRRFTGHLNGAIYGAPDKHPDGRTHLSNLFVCGTDQGWVGIIGSIISGISMANKHLLMEESS
ncbi:MAG TPA: NAD(P)/FAD-dependent oxidoreductase [Pirellulales bacterium]|jgi:phytoene dehydrogenase-like protein|nr:NAD(P)/FAD-dependent oxidoreductase [Pirellulales bacterium]